MLKLNAMPTTYAVATGGVTLSILALVAIYAYWAKIHASDLQNSIPGMPENPVQSAPAAVAAAPQALANQVSEESSVSASDVCSKLRTAPERLICSNPELGNADAKLTQLFNRVKNMAVDKASLKKDQDYWRQHTRNACSNAKCMLWAYTFRRLELLKVQAMYEDKQAGGMGTPLSQN